MEQDCWKTLYAEAGSEFFTVGRNKFREFTDLRPEGLGEDQSLKLKVETSGKVTATLTTPDAAGKDVTFTASTTLVPLIDFMPGSETLDAEATLVFPANASKGFDGLVLRAVLENVARP